MDYIDYAKVLENCSFFGRFITSLYIQKNVDASVFFRNNQWRIKEWLFGIDWKKTDEGSDYWKEIWLAWCRFVETNDYTHISKWYGKPLEGPKEEKKLKMDFVHILSQCTFYKAFVENLLKVGGYDTIGQCFGSMSEAKVEPRDWIIYAFKWEKTPQGYDFWNEIDKMWKNYVDNNGKGPLPIEGETRNGNEKEVSDTFKVAPRKKEKLKLNFEL